MGFSIIDSNDNHKPSLELGIQRLALEATTLQNVIDTFRNVIPSITDKLSSIADSFIPTDDHTESVQNLKKFVQTHKTDIDNVGIVNHASTLLPVPEGFHAKSKILPFLDHLVKISPDVTKGLQEILSEYQIVLSTFISNKDAKTSIKDHTQFYQRIKKQRLTLTEGVQSFFDPKVDRSRLPFSSIYEQTSDIYTAVDRIDALNMARKKHDLMFVKKQVANSVELLKLVTEQSEKREITEISGAAAMDLSNGAFEVGLWVEFAAIYHFRMEQAISAVNAQVEMIAKLH